MAESLSFLHPLFNHATLYSCEDGRGLLVIKQYWNARFKCCFWSSLDGSWANDILKADRFEEWFNETATPEPYQFYEFRKVLWAVGIRPGPKKRFWETRF